MIHNEQQQISHILIINFFKGIISWEIRALKQYPLITKEVRIVLEAISKTRASCLTGVSRHLETIKALSLRPRTFICFSVSGYPVQTLALIFDLLHQLFHSIENYLGNEN